MVLAELGGKISNALHNFQKKTIVGDDEIKLMLNEISRSLLEADVNIQLVKKLQESVKSEVAMSGEAGGLNQRKIVQQAVMNGIRKMLDPGVKPYVPEPRRTNVIMFVGLQGSGKTTSVTKYAHYYNKKGLKTAVICADTFRAGAYYQLKQNAQKANIKFYGSETESDPVVIARDGVEQLKKEKYQLIIVDTSGRHKQEEALFEEMKQVEEAVMPQDIVYVMSATDGQAIHDQAAEFRNRVKVGSVIITKMDSTQTKGGGALSAVAATRSPIAFIGTGEHVLEDFEAFNPKSFVTKMMGGGDISGLVDTIKDANIDENSETYKRLQEGVFTMRDMYEHISNIMKLGPMGKLMEMIPGMQGLNMTGPGGQDGTQTMKNFIHIIDSMTPGELDSMNIKKLMTQSRVKRIARGCGRHVQEVNHLLMAFTKFEEVVKKIGKAGFKAMASGDPSAMMGRQGQQMIGNLGKALNPQMLKQLGGMGGLQNMMQQLSQFEGK